VSDHKNGNANSCASARDKTEWPLLLPAEAIIRIELEVEERVRQSITHLVTNPEWADILGRRSRPRQFDTDTRHQRRELLLIVASFARKYKKLLEGAVVEFCREIGQACRKAGHPGTPADAEHAWQRGCQFAERFTIGEYAEPWGGFFMLKPSPTAYPLLRDDEADAETITGEFQKANALIRLFDDVAHSVKVAAEAEGLTGLDYVWREYATHADGWKNGSASRAKNQFLIVTEAISKAIALVPPQATAASTTGLTQREEKMWDVIRRGARGMQYCRELANAGIGPRRKGAWKDAPRNYPAAYRMGEPWRHRIQDEKSKIRHKAKLAGLAKDSLASKSMSPAKPA
jgi:hypothetical protein